MSHITAHQMIAFTDELRKEGGVADWLKRGYGAAKGVARKVPGWVRGAAQAAGPAMTSTYGRQLATGAAAGALGGAALGEEGQRGKAALKGALLGTGIAGGRILATKAGREKAKKGLSNFKDRQLYSLTGKTSDKAPMTVERARDIGLIPKAQDFAKITDPAKRAKAQALELAEEKAVREGFLSVPGVAHAALTRPGELLRSGWERAGTTGKLFAGLGAAEAAHGFVKRPEEGGPGRLESGMKGLGSAAGWLVAPGGSMIAGHLVGEGAGRLAGKVGKAVGTVADVAKARRQQAQPELPSYYGYDPSQGSPY